MQLVAQTVTFDQLSVSNSAHILTTLRLNTPQLARRPAGWLAGCACECGWVQQQQQQQLYLGVSRQHLHVVLER